MSTSRARVAAVLLCAALITAASAFSTPVRAQEAQRPFDLSVSIETDATYVVTATNHGNDDAFGVRVHLDIGAAVIRNYVSDIGLDDRDVNLSTGIWNIGTLPAGRSYGLEFGTDLPDGVTVRTTIPLVATLANDAPVEADIYLHNNTATAWKSTPPTGNSAEARYISRFEVQIDNRFPEASETATFTIELENLEGNRSEHSTLYDVEVDIGLAGLKLSAAPQPPAGTTFDGAPPAAGGQWNVDTLHRNSVDGANRYELAIAAALDGDVPLEERCLTATVAESTPPPESVRPTVTVANSTITVCLGQDPPILFEAGDLNLFYVYPCVGVATYPCGSDDTLEMVTTVDGAPYLAGIHRTDIPGTGINAGNAILLPEKVVVQVKDPLGRHADGDWRTGGRVVTHTLATSALTASEWTHLKRSIAVPTGVILPGSFSIRPATALTFNFLDPVNAQTAGPFAFNNTFSAEQVAIFGTLGTYQVAPAFEFTHATIDENMDGNKDKFTASATYTFHVGPIAELEVRDGDENPAVPAGQWAFTIVAVNNGPDDAPAAQVTVTGLDAGSCTGNPTKGSIAFADNECTWTIGELRGDVGYYPALGYPLGGPTLTIITSAAEDTEITAAITNTQDYQVCIDSDGDDVDLSSPSETACTTEDSTNTWHTTPYYDYVSDNDTATIKAEEGTGKSLPGSPSARQVPASILVEWTGVDELNGSPVTHYEIEWSEDGETDWQQLSDNVPEKNRYVDAGVGPGDTRYYRVRAVNLQNHLGPWSQPIRASAETLGFPGISVSATTFTIAEGQSGEYTVVLKARPISNVSVRVNRSGDVSPNPGRLTFTPSNWFTPQTVTLNAGQDNDAVDDAVDVTHTISSSDSAYASLTLDPVAVTVIDDDSGVSIEAAQESVNEGDDIDLTLTRTGNTGSAIMVTVNVGQSGNYLASGESGNRTVDMGAGTTTATITVATDNDTVLENPGSVFANVVGGATYFASSPSSVTVRVQDDDGPPGLPVGLAAEERDGAVRLTWTAAPTGDAPVLDYSYRVRRSGSSAWDPDWTVLSGGSGRRSHTESGLTNGYEYTFQVRARNDTGDGAAAEVTANPKDEPGAPEVTVESRNESLLVTWSVPDGGGRTATEYRIQWKSGSESFDSSRQADVTDQEYTIPTLTNGTEYRVRVQAMNEVGWGDWSGERPGTPTPRPATSLTITTDAQDGVGEPFRLTFTFTDEDHEGTEYGVKDFEVGDIEAWYTSGSFYEFTLEEFKEETPGLVYSARVNQLLDGNLFIRVPEGAAKSTHDEQESMSADFAIEVEPPEADQPAGTEIWSAVMTVGDYSGNAVGYINPDLSIWDPGDTIGSLSDGDDATDDDDTFTYAGKNYWVGELTIVRAWNTFLFISCPGLEGADATFDLFLDDQVDGHRDHSLSFDPEEAETYQFSRTIDGATQSCVEYRWTPHRADWEKDGKVNVRIVK